MQALGQLSLVDRAQAEIQSQVANFLAMKSKLIRLQSSPSLQVKSKAAGLYAVQVQLEGELQRNLAKIEQVKQTGSFSISDTLSIGEFTSRLIKHINDVGNLEREGALVVSTQQAVDWGMWPVAAIIAGAVVLVYWNR